MVKLGRAHQVTLRFSVAPAKLFPKAKRHWDIRVQRIRGSRAQKLPVNGRRHITAVALRQCRPKQKSGIFRNEIQGFVDTV